ncbi:MAG: 23S rRNA (adenine(2503)-C(2))-methyltransferase RlmN [Spirochaetaceae bacterium]|jgi:23S rRNA (adenine2503-C2)-methyltransferase|nr:23S rRNA (adenine(2503)-C(2))-methyltransferase RlmN [Spirochaetaceae bacterium]
MLSKPSLSGVPPAELETLLSPLPAYRSKQIFGWINRGACSFEAMNNLPVALRHELDGRFCLRKTAVANRLEDSDGGAIKLQISVQGGLIEAVVLQDAAGRRTACLSTQLGCPMGCVFCKTGSMGFIRNLDSAEITEQFYHIRALYPGISNIVIMGMGEPLLNLVELRRSLSVLCETASPRRVTVSTCGLADGIVSLADSGPAVRLAVSLTTAREDLRRRLMPAAAANPLGSLKEAIMYHQKRRGRRITLEAVMLGGINTSVQDADAMAAFASGLDVVVNLIPWNPARGLAFEGSPLKEPSATELGRFRSFLEERGLKTVLRRKKGRSIAGACGQLGCPSPPFNAAR